MNERIRELMRQATEYKSNNGDGTESPVLNPEKFAGLIAQECAELCDRFQARDVGMQPAECAGAIRNMFGVKQ